MLNDISIVRGITAASTTVGAFQKTLLSSDQLPDFELESLCWKGLKRMSIDSLFPVQKICCAIINRKLTEPKFSSYDCDVCVSAPTGSGKSLAYILPIVHGLARRSRPALRALIVLPTRDLALQVRSVIAHFCEQEGSNLKVQTLVGQNSMSQERAELMAIDRCPDIAVATMGRLIDHLVIGSLDLSFLRWLVVDEADRMLSKSDLDKWSLILGSVPDTCHRLLFSATMTANPLKLNKLRLTRPLFISVGSEPSSSTALPSTITHRYSVVPNKSMKVRCLLKILELLFTEEGSEISDKRVNRCLILCRTNENVQALSALLKSYYIRESSRGVVPRSFSGNLTGKQRERLLARFANDEINCLVSTDVITRGIDIPNIDVVISYDVPNHYKTYVHRAGRTGRAGKSGLVISLAESKEMRHFRKEILSGDARLKKSMTRLTIDFGTVMKHEELEGIAADNLDDD
jgi:ATP-dependent RNA helicase DDX51/DBP6